MKRSVEIDTWRFCLYDSEENMTYEAIKKELIQAKIKYSMVVEIPAFWT